MTEMVIDFHFFLPFAATLRLICILKGKCFSSLHPPNWYSLPLILLQCCIALLGKMFWESFFNVMAVTEHFKCQKRNVHCYLFLWSLLSSGFFLPEEVCLQLMEEGELGKGSWGCSGVPLDWLPETGTLNQCNLFPTPTSISATTSASSCLPLVRSSMYCMNQREVIGGNGRHGEQHLFCHPLVSGHGALAGEELDVNLACHLTWFPRWPPKFT